ncbi:MULTISPECIES: hypothetical protein [unclassified Candidatus Frackibacter]|uniref:hypothetical protein n=1 Tax=unclassified Candidatus Frackibacter TaxID=2648818 RepID=UPI000885B94D|nr:MULTISPECIES: hypothetical protein [unclassified Candidatus Frackibacter]SDC03800.1 hypothetical protein SAMN04515661_101390 [Candidatus Frackibacter sp. WG11]SEM68624.1 hypothetical protein SAMN04488698_11220 [Candidatus Frackibacter sp. WG12]SFL79925.1 hypothetical protein SAMN04488699_11420 [Candidatus Frackibacter sp. WG13]
MFAKDNCELKEEEESITCPQCGVKVNIEELESLRCPRCFAVLLKKCEDCNKCK